MYRQRNKFNNKKTIYNGIKFDSKKECERYKQLIMQQDGGLISDLKLQPKFEFKLNGHPIMYKSRRKLTYKADFQYHCHKSGKTVVEDAKGFKTPEYKIKWALMKYINNITVIEV